MILEYTISLGNLLTILTTVGSVIALVYSMRGDIRILQNDMTHLQKNQQSLNEAFTQLGKILTSVAVQDTRITLIEKRVDDLSHGKGFVK